MDRNYILFYSINRGVIYMPKFAEEHNIGDFIEIYNKRYKIKDIESILIATDPPIRKQIAYTIDMSKKELESLNIKK